MVERLVKAIIGVLLPPVLVAVEKGLGVDFVVNLLLTLFLIWIGGIIHAFYLCGVTDLIKNILSVFLPPLAVCLHRGLKVDFLVSILLTLLGWIPGMIHAYYINMGWFK